jgi:hypothetical protein
MMSSLAWSASCPIILPCHTRSAVCCCHVGLGCLTTIAVSCEWSIGLALHCSHMSAHLAGHNCSGACAFETCDRTLGTREPNYISRPVKPFFTLEARGPQKATRCVAVLKPSPAGRRGMVPWDTWQHWSSP